MVSAAVWANVASPSISASSEPNTSFQTVSSDTLRAKTYSCRDAISVATRSGTMIAATTLAVVSPAETRRR